MRHGSWPSEAYKRYVLGVLTLVFTLSYLDRGLINLLLQPIKADLHLSDTQLGLLTGIAFALFYSTLGLPIARWADRGNRVTITAIACGFWGVTVMLCLFVSNFTQLFVARIAAGVGEVGCVPPTYSLVGDYFPKAAERTRALAVYFLANPLHQLVSFVVGGWLAERFGWRFTFFVMGIPALLVAVLVKLTVVEPREQASGVEGSGAQSARMADVLATLWQQRSARHLCIALILLSTVGAGLGPWSAAFMMRSHGMHIAELGVWLGLISGISGFAGILLGGYVAGRWLADDERRQMRLSAIAVASLIPFNAVFLLVPGKRQAMMALGPLLMVISIFFAPTFALLQRLVSDQMRATTLTVVMLLSNLIGMGVGPLIVGTLSDLMSPVFGSDALRYAMLILTSVSLWAGYHLWEVGRTIKEDLVAAAYRYAPNANPIAPAIL